MGVVSIWDERPWSSLQMKSLGIWAGLQGYSGSPNSVNDDDRVDSCLRGKLCG